MTDVVNGLLVRDGRILMAYRSKDRPRYPDCWSFPGGGVEDGETLEQALLRELGEEIGIVPTHYVSFDQLYDCPVMFHFFLVTKWTGDIANLGDEHVQLRWMSFDNAAAQSNLALEGYRQLLRSMPKTA